MKEIDARGLACPAPVLQTKAAIDQGADLLKVVLDNEASQENVRRFLDTQGFETSLETDGTTFFVSGNRNGVVAQSAGEGLPLQPEGTNIMVMITTDRMGYGDDDLGLKLMVNFIKTLKEMGSALWRLVFVNNGVKLTIQDSAVLADLTSYQSEGLQILVCGTCLDHFNLLDQKQVGETTNMLDIVTAMQVADKVINI
jgi:selenium metabolism protein YedF